MLQVEQSLRPTSSFLQRILAYMCFIGQFSFLASDLILSNM